MVKPVHIFIDRKELHGYTSMTLRRSKNEMTGELNVTVFMGWLPKEPVMVEATKGREILVYIGGHLAFTGAIDRRRDSSTKGSKPADSTVNASIGPNDYTVTFTARGKTKYLIDSSQQHPTSTILKTTSREVFDLLVSPWGTEIVWEAEDDKLDKLRLRDGGMVVDELSKVADQCSLFMYESRDGKLKVTDSTVAISGEPIALGTNILQFSTDQAEDKEKSEVLVKGQRIEKEQWGESACLPTVLKAKTALDSAFLPITVQHYGNATPELLAKRAQYESNKRSSEAKRVTVDVFHIQQSTGQPWDIGSLHYVEIPPANVFDLMEVVELEYNIQANGTLSTKLTLSPAPVKPQSPSGKSEFLADLPEIDIIKSMSISRKAMYGVQGTGLDWASPIIQFLTNPLPTITSIISGFLDGVEIQNKKPPLELPPGYKSQDEK